MIEMVIIDHQMIPLYKLSRASQCKSFICNIHLRFSLIQVSFVFDSERLRIEKGTRFRPRALFQLLLDFISAASNSPKSNQRNRPNLSIICPTKNHYYLYTFNYIIYFKHTWRLLLYFFNNVVLYAKLYLAQPHGQKDRFSEIRWHEVFEQSYMTGLKVKVPKYVGPENPQKSDFHLKWIIFLWKRVLTR